MVFGYQQLQNQFTSKSGFLCPIRRQTLSHEHIANCLIDHSNFHLPVCNSASLLCKQQVWWRKRKCTQIFFSNFDVVDCSSAYWFLKCRFYCASAVDNRTRLDFHGEPRIWNGHLIKQIIKGNSTLYIYVDEVFQLKCFLRCIIVVWETNSMQCVRVSFLFQGKGFPITYMDTVQYSTRKCMDGLSSTVILRITTLYSKKMYQSSDHRFTHDSWMVVSKISKRFNLVFPISKRQLNLSWFCCLHSQSAS